MGRYRHPAGQAGGMDTVCEWRRTKQHCYHGCIFWEVEGNAGSCHYFPIVLKSAQFSVNDNSFKYSPLKIFKKVRIKQDSWNLPVICNEAVEVWHQVSLANSNGSFQKRVLCQISPILINSEIWINDFVGNLELLSSRLAAFPVLHHTGLPCWAHRGLGLVQQRAGRHKTSEWLKSSNSHTLQPDMMHCNLNV